MVIRPKSIEIVPNDSRNFMVDELNPINKKEILNPKIAFRELQEVDAPSEN